MQVVTCGVNGPDCLSSTVWDTAFIVGMVAGAWIGPVVVPYIDPPSEMAGGWFSVVCLMATQFVPVSRKLRPELGDGGFLRQMLRTHLHDEWKGSPDHPCARA